MRLRDISELARGFIENDPELLFGPGVIHPLVQEIRDPHHLYRSVAPASRKDTSHCWLTFSFEPYRGLLDPFQVYSGRQWAMLRMHRQSSGLPELLVHIGRELPSASTPIVPDLSVSFSHSPRVDTVVKKVGREPGILRFFHKGDLVEPNRDTLPAEFCIPGFQEALPDGDPEDGIPGVITDEHGISMIFLGDLVFYNQFRTADRNQLRSFLCNSVGVAVVARYVRDIVRKSASSAQQAG